MTGADRSARVRRPRIPATARRTPLPGFGHLLQGKPIPDGQATRLVWEGNVVDATIEDPFRGTAIASLLEIRLVPCSYECERMSGLFDRPRRGKSGRSFPVVPRV